MTKKPNSDQADLGLKIRARVLLDCSYGRANDVVELTAAEIESARSAGAVDDHPDAVKYAESLKAKE